MKSRKLTLVSTLILVFVLGLSPVLAQSEDYSLVFKREWGFGFPGVVQGRMSMTVKGDLDQVERVVYFMDDVEMLTGSAPKIKVFFNTDDYAPGDHGFYAVVTTKDGKTHQTASFSVRFISGTDARKSTRTLLIAIGAGILFIAIISFLFTRRRQEEHKKAGVIGTGPMGAAICPNCHQAFNLGIFGINLFTRRYVACPYCRKWSLVRRAKPEELAELERNLKAEIEEDISNTELDISRDEKLDELDETKYTEL